MLYYIAIHSCRVGLPPWHTKINVGAIGGTRDVPILYYDYLTDDLSRFKKLLTRTLKEENGDEVIMLDICHFRCFMKKINKV